MNHDIVLCLIQGLIILLGHITKRYGTAALLAMLALLLSVRHSNAAEEPTIRRISSRSALNVPDERAEFVVSNKCDVPISVWRVSEDGFGYVVEVMKEGKWKPLTDYSWCATGREIVEIPSGENYFFTIPVPSEKVVWRITLEYWIGKFGEGKLKSISSIEQRNARGDDSVQIK